MKYLVLVLAVMLTSAGARAAPPSSKKCAQAAADQTEKLLRFHLEYADGDKIENHEKPTPADVTALPTQAVDKKHSLQVLQVATSVYKADYTAVMKFAELVDASKPGGVDCVLMGQEIIDDSNPW